MTLICSFFLHTESKYFLKITIGNLMFWIKVVGSTYGDYSSQTVELILWKGFRSKKTLSSKILIYKY